MTETANSIPTANALKTVAVVTGRPDAQVLDAVLDAGDYDVVFIESLNFAYSHIKHVLPHLVIVCLSVEDPRGFQVLSMLQLDGATSHIPVVTIVTASNGRGDGANLPEPEDAPRQPIAAWMN